MQAFKLCGRVQTMTFFIELEQLQYDKFLLHIA